MDTSKNAQEGTQGSASAFTGVTVDFADAVSVVVTRPFMDSMADCAVVRVQAGIVGRFIREQERAARRNAGADDASSADLVRVLDDPVANLAAVPTDDRDNGRAVIVIRAASSSLVGSATRWVAQVGMRRAFFPRILVQLVCLEGTARHHLGGQRLVQVVLDALAQLHHPFASNA